MGVDQCGVVVLPARLVLLGPAMVIDRHDQRAVALGGVPQIDGRLSAVRSDLDSQTGRIQLGQIMIRYSMECIGLVRRHESRGLVGDGAAVVGQRGGPCG